MAADSLRNGYNKLMSGCRHLPEWLKTLPKLLKTVYKPVADTLIGITGYFTGHFLTFTLQNVLSLNLHKLIKEWTTKYIREEM